MLMGDRTTPYSVAEGAIPTPSGEILLHDLPQLLQLHGTLLLLFPGLTGLSEIARMEA
jgi:hypothetical protein